MHAELPGEGVGWRKNLLQQNIELEGQNGDPKQEHCHLAAWDTVSYMIHYFFSDKMPSRNQIQVLFHENVTSNHRNKSFKHSKDELRSIPLQQNYV